jgi:hypothetical protein
MSRATSLRRLGSNASSARTRRQPTGILFIDATPISIAALCLNTRVERRAVKSSMATFSLPRGRGIEVSATVNASLRQQVEITGPGVDHKWIGAGEGQRIGETAINFPPGPDDVEIQVKLSHSEDGENWSPSHEFVTEEPGSGEIRVIGEDGRGALDANDLIVRFRWVV